jgi:8-oxo-dGTP diphosphatase
MQWGEYYMNSFKDKKQEYERAIDRPIAKFDINPVIITPEKALVFAKRIPNVQCGGMWSFPGGKVFDGETIESALKRMTYIKTGLDIELLFPDDLNGNIIGVYDDPGRDPRQHVIGAAFACVSVGGELVAKGNSDKVGAFSIEEALGLELAFDHRQILEDFILYRRIVNEQKEYI